MRRLRWVMILGALAFSGCLSPAPPDGAESEIGDGRNATPLDEAAATDPALVAAEAANLFAPHGPRPGEPCPCDQPICRPGCVNPIAPPPSHVPQADPCPCTDPVCRPVCKNP